MALSNEIRIVRQKAFLSQTEFAKHLGASYTTVNRWENGKSTPTFEKMRRLREFCENRNISFNIIQEKENV